jgi:DUF2911 family protein
MFLLHTLVASWLLAAAPATAQQTGNFVIRLGRDTTSVEHFTQSATRIEVDQAGRAPRVLTRHIVYEFSPKGDLKGLDITVSRPGAAPGALPIQRIHATLDGDSLRGEVRRDTTATPLRSAAPAGTIVNIGSPWLMYEHLAMRFAATKAESLHVPLVYLGGTDVFFATVRRLGKDSLDIRTPTDHFHAQADRAGHLLHVVPLAGTQQFTVDRVPSLDVATTAASFLAAEQQAGAMGALSSRDTVKASIGGATLWIDYGRPSKRGRTIYGGVVPWGVLWRTGANAATQFKTDKALIAGATEIPAGFYTLWTIPSPTGWKLVINSETGQWGTIHHADKDVATLDMAVSALDSPVERFTISLEPATGGAMLHLDWDTTRASLPLQVKP